MIRTILTALAALALSACAAIPPPAAIAPAEQRQPVTILISIDAFRPDYLGKGNTPRLDALAASGVSAPMRPSFPTKTFPNHWAIVTGKRPDTNGIVANKMEDPRRPGEMFGMANDDPFWWNEASPIWVEAEKAGIRTATMFWPGSNVGWGGVRSPDWPNRVSGGTRPSDWQQFSMVVSAGQRVRAIIDWLRRPAETRPKLLTLYFDEVDTASHQQGPFAAETMQEVAAADAAIGMLVDELAALGQPANLVITSDHGMAPTSAERVLTLDRIAAAGDYRVIEQGPYMALEAMPGRAEALEKAILRRHDRMECWRRADIPARFHYGRNPRVPAYLCLAEPGWQIMASKPTKKVNPGEHGYDDRAPDMAALFVASGPGIRAGVKPGDFANVDVYPLLARLIGVAPLPGDGDPKALESLTFP